MSGDPWTAAWEEAATTAPPKLLIYLTLEIRHAAFVDSVTGPFAVRVVQGVASAMSFGIEAGAVLNGGETVEFKPVMFEADKPEVGEGKIPESRISIDNVAREMIPYLQTAVRMRADMSVTYREYRSDDFTAPCYGPITFTIKQVQVSGVRVTGTARIDDLANRKFPNQMYTLTEYPGLQG